jgi:alpha-ketoglutarate-dependent taurine dioxygenase
MEGSSAALTITKLAPAIGAEVSGIDLARPLDAASVGALRRAWHAHGVLLVRGQALAEADQIRYGEYFGVLGTALSESRIVPAHPAVMFVSNIRKNGELIGHLPDGEMFFHSDQCYLATPPAGTMLYGMEVPSSGGNTLFAGMYAAYDALPAAMKARLDGLEALNAYDLKNSATRRGAMPDDAPRHVHPVICVHPATGRKALYVNRLMTQHIVGMDAAESDALLAALFDHQEQRQFVYEHVWRVGDVILWDNRCALHARTDFDPGERRLLRRITVLAEHTDGRA